MTIKEIFIQTLVGSFENPKFLRLLSQGIEIDYNEARSSSFEDDLIIEPFQRYKFGHDRYFLAQSRFVRCALDAGLTVKLERCESNDYPIPIVLTGRLSLTLHYGSSVNEVTCPKTSLIRRQHSDVNGGVLQTSLFEKPNFDINKLNRADHIYANIIHGCDGSGLNFADYGFLRIAVPYAKRIDGKEKFFFIENVNLFDVLEILEAQDATKQQTQPIIDIAIPRIKQRKSGT